MYVHTCQHGLPLLWRRFSTDRVALRHHLHGVKADLSPKSNNSVNDRVYILKTASMSVNHDTKQSAEIWEHIHCSYQSLSLVYQFSFGVKHMTEKNVHI